jgi:hypothetical protein
LRSFVLMLVLGKVIRACRELSICDRSRINCDIMCYCFILCEACWWVQYIVSLRAGTEMYLCRKSLSCA